MLNTEKFKFWIIPRNVNNIEEFINGNEKIRRGRPSLSQEEKRKGYTKPYHRLNPAALKKAEEKSTLKAARDLEFVSLYKSGSTLNDIGELYGLSRERVRQRLVAHGLCKEDGGSAIRQFLNCTTKRYEKIALDEKREQKCMARYGCTLELKKQLTTKPNKESPFRKWIEQKRNAKKRGIPFELTLGQWWSIWQESGHWNERGRGDGKYGMGRVCDMGGYTLDNVKIITCNENMSEARDMDKVRGRWKNSFATIYKDEIAKSGLKLGTIKFRITRGWSIEDALNIPVKNK